MKKVISIALSALMIMLLSVSAFAYDFDESNFDGMIISYTDSGAPVVEDPNDTAAILKAAVTAKTTREAGLYEDTRFNRLIFMIPKGRTVTVVSTGHANNAVRVTYAGKTGYMYPEALQF